MDEVFVGHRWDSKAQKLFVKNKNYQRKSIYNILIIRLISFVKGGVELACLGL